MCTRHLWTCLCRPLAVVKILHFWSMWEQCLKKDSGRGWVSVCYERGRWGWRRYSTYLFYIWSLCILTNHVKRGFMGWIHRNPPLYSSVYITICMLTQHSLAAGRCFVYPILLYVNSVYTLLFVSEEEGHTTNSDKSKY